MPFDGEGFQEPAKINVKKLKKLKKLISLLRDEKQWPAGFAWNYTNHSTCAMGLAVAAGLIPVSKCHTVVNSPSTDGRFD